MANYWVYVPSWELAIAAPPKCGSRSVLISIVRYFDPSKNYESVRPSVYATRNKNYQYIDKSEVKPLWNKLAIVRDPVDRFLSLWLHHCQDHVPGIPKHLRGFSQIQLIKFIARHLYDDPHWAPQCHTIGQQQKIDYVYLHSAEKIWSRLAPCKLDHVNKTKSASKISSDVKELIFEIYSGDYELLEKTNE